MKPLNSKGGKGSKSTRRIEPDRFKAAVEEILAIAQESGRAHDWEDALLLGIGGFTGFRVSDFHNLTWKHLGEEIAKTEKKTGKYREVPIAGTLARIVNGAKGAGMCPSDKSKFLFRPRGGPRGGGLKPLTRKGVTDRLRALAQRLNLPTDISAHCLRKTNAYAAYRYFIDVKKVHSSEALMNVCDMLNHKDIRVTRVYLDLVKNEISDFYDNF